MKKKLLALSLIAVMSLSFTACGGGNTSSSSDTKTKAEATTAAPETATEKVEPSVADELIALEGTPLTDAMKKIKECGYTATYYADGEDFTSFIDSMKDDYTTGAVEVNEDNKSVEVTLELTSNIEANKQEEKLKEKLDTGTAWGAAKAYGKEQYGDDFDLHYLTGKIAQYADDKDTWFLKAECEVNGQEGTCEAKVTGTSDNPKVISFDVY